MTTPSTIETISQLDPLQLAQEKLTQAKKSLADRFHNSEMDIQTYEELVVEYINSFMCLYFGDLPPAFATLDDVGRTIKENICFIANEETIPIPEIINILTKYNDDERARWLKARNYPLLPRAVVHTLFDLIDMHKPTRFSKNKSRPLAQSWRY